MHQHVNAEDKGIGNKDPVNCDNESLINGTAAFCSAVNLMMAHDVAEAEAETPMRMSLNARGSTLDEHGKMLGLESETWLNPEGIANAASSGNSSDQCHVHFNNAIEDAFVLREWEDIEGENAVKFPCDCVLNLCSHKFGN